MLRTSPIIVSHTSFLALLSVLLPLLLFPATPVLGDEPRRPFVSKRCPPPKYNLCNRNQSDPNTFLDSLLNSYFKDPYDTSLPGDRELVWWTLAGGDEGRWWWDPQSPDDDHNGEVQQPPGLRDDRKLRRDLRNDTEAWEEAERQRLEKEEQEKELGEDKKRWNGSYWKDEPEDRGFCCVGNETCMALEVDRSLVVCIDEKALILKTPDNVTLNVRTLEITYPNNTKIDLRDFQVPPRNKNLDYSPPRPSLMPQYQNLTAAAGGGLHAFAGPFGIALWVGIIGVLFIGGF